MTWLWLILVVAVLGVTTAVAAGRGDRMRAVYSDRPDVGLPADRLAGAQDLAGLRFSVVLRGYRMDEVDDLVGRLTREIAVRDAELARLSEHDAPARARHGDRSAQNDRGAQDDRSALGDWSALGDRDDRDGIEPENA